MDEVGWVEVGGDGHVLPTLGTATGVLADHVADIVAPSGKLHVRPAVRGPSLVHDAGTRGADGRVKGILLGADESAVLVTEELALGEGEGVSLGRSHWDVTATNGNLDMASGGVDVRGEARGHELLLAFRLLPGEVVRRESEAPFQVTIGSPFGERARREVREITIDGIQAILAEAILAEASLSASCEQHHENDYNDAFQHLLPLGGHPRPIREWIQYTRLFCYGQA